MILFSFTAFVSLLAFPSVVHSKPHCKLSPLDAGWPSTEEWAALNASIQGALIKTTPVASSCYPGNPFGSTENCTIVTKYWSYAAYHSAWPESVDYSVYTNNSCVAPGVAGYTEGRGCSIGALPQYIVNATTEEQVAKAMQWASKRNIRVVVKGTGHDLSGRSTGAYSLSIWTHNFRHIVHRPSWRVPASNHTADVVIVGSGNNWGSIYTAVHAINRTVVGGEDATVGPGGLIQNGGHGLLSSHHGLASDQVYQVTVITTDGRRLVANHAQNEDLFWAVRGGGGGQFGVVTEFVLKTYPVPANVVTGGLSFYPSRRGKASELASWDALAETARTIPDLMDSGFTGTVMALTKEAAMRLTGANVTTPGVAVSINLIGYNTTTKQMNSTLHHLAARIKEYRNSSALTLSYQPPSTQSYWAFVNPDPLASRASGARTRKGGMLLLGLQGGAGPATTPPEMRGSVLPAWRSAYVHAMVYGASIDDTADPSKALATVAEWHESTIEPVWRRWAPDTGSYMNEGNAFSRTWKKDFYGENYDKLLAVKRTYDPSESLFVWSGVGSDMWEYDLRSGLLCRR
ncbi:putative isoamyl alcohol oxidase [Aspergillus novofumigatus IBT 16806]|uniref:FAD binding domain protein n=1 Tax=Aspergillus novofumigatus (strain IBT 16806) TaxID=1392255 RepID=A0A2I1BXF6_ASPN1|nr:FAD binding domain protein [Aspergillus novofumigatus IBT 16806]PKX90057.1 FAD binding domain protein [Aspergillus novofumigatus IBT 16806]